ncbi:MAG: hypothetical protein DMG38_20765 [Acidobacteria bacterium]|nr:MAG: hypothetical protein DMG38_20765 [Acidobacteriota bacterium]
MLAKSVPRSCFCAILESRTRKNPITRLEWLNEASGARAFINQTTPRIALDRTRNPDAAFVMKYHVKTKGLSESIYIERVLDENGEAISVLLVSSCSPT